MPRGLQAKPRHKFRATPVTQGGRRYDSKKEARYAADLKLRKQAGDVVGWLEQVPFHLPGGITYRVDFLEFRADGSVAFVDVKGYETKEFRMKMRLLREAYPWAEITVV